MKLTKDEQKRITQIRKTLRKFKRRKCDVSTWEATFFLGLIDRLVKK